MPISEYGVWVVMVMGGVLNWEGIGNILQCWEGLSYNQLYQNPLLQPGSQAITSPGYSPIILPVALICLLSTSP